MQKRLIRMLQGIVGLNYKERLDRLGCFALERPRLRGELIEVYKIMWIKWTLTNFYPGWRILKQEVVGLRWEGEISWGISRVCFSRTAYSVSGMCCQRKTLAVDTITTLKANLDRYMDRKVCDRYGPLVNTNFVSMDKVGRWACFHLV